MDVSQTSKEQKHQENEAAGTSRATQSTMAPGFCKGPEMLQITQSKLPNRLKLVGSSAPSLTTSPSDSRDNTDNHDPFSIFSEGEDMRVEENRIKTFQNWPVTFLSPEKLAKNGFYYLGRGDEVRCAFCKVEIMRWVEGDDPAKDHRRWSPQCPSHRKTPDSGNVPLTPPNGSGRDECGVHSQSTTPNCVVHMPGPVHQRYASVSARLQSFKDWPRCMRQKPEDLAEAGFFYTGQGDKTKCFYCDGGLKDWEPEDIPWEQHALWFDRCAYVQLVRGRDYVQRVMSEAAAIPGPVENKPSITEPKKETISEQRENGENEEKVDENKLCKICYAEERNVCFVPCGHVVACAKCALSTNKCPMCRKVFTNALRLYFA